MFLVRKNDISLAFFSSVKLIGNKLILKNPENINFLYSLLHSISMVEEVDVSIHDEKRHVLKLKANISNIEIYEDYIEMTIM